MSSPSPVPEAAIRRKPRQERSNDTVQQIFQAASSLLARHSLEDITTTLIAAEAQVSVGALYRFFPDKQSILDAIALRHMEDFRSRLLLTAAKAILSDGPGFLAQVIDAYVAYLEEHPDFRALALGRHISPAARAQQALPDSGPASLVRSFLLRKLSANDPAALDLKLRVTIETGERLIAFAYQQPTPEERAKVLNEMKILLAAYLFPR